MAVLQAYSVSGAEYRDGTLSTPDYLEFNAQDPSSLEGVLDSLAAACEREDIASPEDLQDALAACYAAQGWIECRTDTPPSGAYVCPGDVSPWRARFHAIFDRWRAFNGQLDLASITFSLAQLID